MNEIREISFDNPEYPERLRRLADPPPFLYIHGVAGLNDLKTLAIVGTRSPFYKAFEVAWLIGRVAGELGYTIVSGYATGVDTCGHMGAMDANASTIAVLGSGINRKLPSKQALERYVLSHGLFVSELDDPNADREYTHLKARDRITSALSDVVIVVETDKGGGAVRTAKYASQQGQRALAIEWADSEKYHNKVRDGTAYAIEKRIAEALPILDAGNNFSNHLRQIL